MTSVEIIVSGDQRVRARLRALMARSMNWRPAFIEIERVFEHAQRSWFESEGRRSWPPLAAATAAWKRTHGMSSSTLVRTGRLRASLTSSTADSIRDMSNDRFAFGTKLRYAGYHRAGTPHMPKRRPGVKVDTPLLVEVAKVLRVYIMGRLA